MYVQRRWRVYLYRYGNLLNGDVRQTFEDYYSAYLKMYHLAAEQGCRWVIKGIGRFSIDEFDFDLIVFGLLYEM